MNSKPRVLVVVTGQMRNCTDNIENWLSTLLRGVDAQFLFHVWDEIGQVDPAKAHLYCLKTFKVWRTSFTQVSAKNVYLVPARSVDEERKLVESKLGDALAGFVVHTYKPEYMVRAGDLEMPEALQQDSHPWWRGAVPVSFINHKSWMDIQSQPELRAFDYYCRIQSEAHFKPNAHVVWDHPILNGGLLTSANSIDPELQISIKFFAGKVKPFELMMNAYSSLIHACANYKRGTPFHQQPIGERYLKQIAVENNIPLHYGVSMAIKRDQIVPLRPCYKLSRDVKREWKDPVMVPVPLDVYRTLKD